MTRTHIPYVGDNLLVADYLGERCVIQERRKLLEPHGCGGPSGQQKLDDLGPNSTVRLPKPI